MGYIWRYRHYVVFCRRQQDPSRCVFFNDLPAITFDAPKDVDWDSVPSLCRRYFLAPRLALYEDPQGVLPPLRPSPSQRAQLVEKVMQGITAVRRSSSNLQGQFVKESSSSNLQGQSVKESSSSNLQGQTV